MAVKFVALAALRHNLQLTHTATDTNRQVYVELLTSKDAKFHQEVHAGTFSYLVLLLYSINF